MNTKEELQQIAEMERTGEMKSTIIDKGMSEPVLREKRRPTEKTGHFSGERGNSMFYPKSANAIKELRKYGIDGVIYKKGNPDFTPFCRQNTPWGTIDFSVDIGHMTPYRHSYIVDGVKNQGNYEQAEQAFWKLVNNLSGEQVSLLKFREWYQINGLTIHECENGSKVQLIPSVIHEACRHDGGVKEKKYEFLMGDISLFDGLE